MAKLSGPEEFFEVFSDKQAKQSSGDRPAENLPVEPRVGLAPREKTVTIQVRTLAIACASAVLLIVLSYFVGLSHRPEARPLGRGADQPGGRSHTNGPTNLAGAVDDRDDDSGRSVSGQSDGDPSSSGGTVQEARRDYVLVVASYNKTPLEAQYANEVVSYLKQQEELDSIPASIGTRVMGPHLVVCIGPFSSTKSKTARKAFEAVRRMSYRGKTFDDALFLPISQSR